MPVEPFARPSLELSKPLLGGLEVAAAPSGGQGLALDETGRIPSGLLWTRYRKVTSKTISNSTSTTDLLNSEIVIPAGALLANGILRLTAWGSFVQNTGGTTNSPRWAVALGGTTLLDTSALTSSATTSAQECTWRVVAIVEAADAARHGCRRVRVRSREGPQHRIEGHGGAAGARAQRDAADRERQLHDHAQGRTRRDSLGGHVSDEPKYVTTGELASKIETVDAKISALRAWGVAAFLGGQALAGVIGGMVASHTTPVDAGRTALAVANYLF
jgi:hypothetical protein